MAYDPKTLNDESSTTKRPFLVMYCSIDLKRIYLYAVMIDNVTALLYTHHTFDTQYPSSKLFAVVKNSKVNITIGMERYSCTMQQTLGIVYFCQFISIGMGAPTVPKYDPLIQVTLTCYTF